MKVADNSTLAQKALLWSQDDGLDSQWALLCPGKFERGSVVRTHVIANNGDKKYLRNFTSVLPADSLVLDILQ